ncbi:Uncharacterised protein [Chlamydia trachomatis]|nr:Uncharacterised protein [Chlamydia trachomatis]
MVGSHNAIIHEGGEVGLLASFAVVGVETRRQAHGKEGDAHDDKNFFHSELQVFDVLYMRLSEICFFFLEKQCAVAHLNSRLIKHKSSRKLVVGNIDVEFEILDGVSFIGFVLILLVGVDGFELACSHAIALGSSFNLGSIGNEQGIETGNFNVGVVANREFCSHCGRVDAAGVDHGLVKRCGVAIHQLAIVVHAVDVGVGGYHAIVAHVIGKPDDLLGWAQSSGEVGNITSMGNGGKFKHQWLVFAIGCFHLWHHKGALLLAVELGIECGVE